jgi:hypothetical protein
MAPPTRVDRAAGLRTKALLPLIVLAGCGGGSSEPGPSRGTPVVSDPGASHVHGVGINPADGSVVVATHTGLFRAAPGALRAERVGTSRQDTMGFTVVGPDRFLGSGHPDPRAGLPPLLGLIGSGDGGRTWRRVSLLGEADFHVLRAAGQRVYGVNAADGALMASADGGRTWTRHAPPGPVLDLAIDPRDRARIVVSGERGLAVSNDGGRSWRPLEAERAGLLAWADELVLVDAAGEVNVSDDAGRSFARVGSLGGQPAALAAHEGQLLAALQDGTVYRSADGGRTWELRVEAPM